MMKSVICAVLSALPQLPSLSASQSGDETTGDRNTFSKVSGSAFLVPPRITAAEAFVFPRVSGSAFVFWDLNSNDCGVNC